MKTLLKIWELSADPKFAQTKMVHSPIEKHISILSTNAVNIATHIESNSLYPQTLMYSNCNMFINNLIKLRDYWEEYTAPKENNSITIAQFTFKSAPIISDIIRMRGSSPLFINIGDWLNQFIPKSNELIWFGSEETMNKRTKKMLKGIEKLGFDEYGYPIADGGKRFIKVFGFTACAFNNNDIMLTMEFMRLLKNIHKMKLSIFDNVKEWKNSHLQWHYQINSWIRLLKIGLSNMEKYHHDLQTSIPVKA